MLSRRSSRATRCSSQAIRCYPSTDASARYGTSTSSRDSVRCDVLTDNFSACGHFYCGEQKPQDEAECRAYLRSYRNFPVMTVTALVVTNLSAGGSRVSVVDVAKQYFRDVPDDIIDALIAKGDVLHSAGGVTVEDPLLAPYLAERIGTEDSSTFTGATDSGILHACGLAWYDADFRCCLRVYAFCQQSWAYQSSRCESCSSKPQHSNSHWTYQTTVMYRALRQRARDLSRPLTHTIESVPISPPPERRDSGSSRNSANCERRDSRNPRSRHVYLPPALPPLPWCKLWHRLRPPPTQPIVRHPTRKQPLRLRATSVARARRRRAHRA
jgi:hypothetical protein